MKNLFTALILILVFSCKESGVQLGKPTTFVHYYNGGFNDEAQTVIETSDKGFLILANSINTTVTGSPSRIKLIKTDAFGNQLWQRIFPDPALDSLCSLAAYSITAIPNETTSEDDGYLLVGEEIYDNNLNPNNANALLMIQVDKNGNAVPGKTVIKNADSVGVKVQGLGVAYSSSTSSFIIVGRDKDIGLKDMFLGAFDASTLYVKWTQTYGDAATTLTNKVFLSGDSIFFGGTATSSTNSLMTWKKTPHNSLNPLAGNQYPKGVTTINFSCNDICQYGQGFGMIGSYGLTSNTSAKKYSRIAFIGLDQHGGKTDSATYNLKFSQSDEAGNSITGNRDGGYVILGTTAVDDARSDTNYYLMKIGINGKKIWVKEYGGRFFDTGKQVIESSDGGYIVLGTTTLANRTSIFLMKTDSNGNIQ